MRTRPSAFTTGSEFHGPPNDGKGGLATQVVGRLVSRVGVGVNIISPVMVAVGVITGVGVTVAEITAVVITPGVVVTTTVMVMVSRVGVMVGVGV